MANLDRPAPLLHDLPELIATVNDEFADSLLLVARALAGVPTADRCELVAVDVAGVQLRVVDGDSVHPARVDFDEEVRDPEAVTSALFALVVRAGEVVGEPVVSEDRRIRTFLTSVVAVSDVTPVLRQVTFGGGDLTSFEPLGPDTFLYLLLPPPGRTELGIDQSFTWEAHAAMAPEDQPRGAYYTLRSWRPDAAELDIWMVLHGDEGEASSWAGRARPGDQVALWGPRTAYEPPADTESVLLVADETGLPAVAAILEQLPDHWSATVVAESDPAHRQPLPRRQGVDVRWCDRVGAAPGSTQLLVEAVEGLPALPECTYVWGGGESRAMAAVRRHVRDVRGLERDSVSLVAYWRA